MASPFAIKGYIKKVLEPGDPVIAGMPAVAVCGWVVEILDNGWTQIARAENGQGQMVRTEDCRPVELENNRDQNNPDVDRAGFPTDILPAYNPPLSQQHVEAADVKIHYAGEPDAI